MTAILPGRVPGPRVHYSQRRPFQPLTDYDERDRQLDDADGGQRWRNYSRCLREPSDKFFPEDNRGVEPPYPPPDVKQICEQCPVAGRCLQANMNEEYGIFGGMTGYQRSLMNRKIHRKACVSCGSTDVVDKVPHHEICLACGVSWEVL